MPYGNNNVEVYFLAKSTIYGMDGVFINIYTTALIQSKKKIQVTKNVNANFSSSESKILNVVIALKLAIIEPLMVLT